MIVSISLYVVGKIADGRNGDVTPTKSSAFVNKNDQANGEKDYSTSAKNQEDAFAFQGEAG